MKPVDEPPPPVQWSRVLLMVLLLAGVILACILLSGLIAPQILPVPVGG